MSFLFRLPDIGEGLEEAEIVEWLVAPGDVVSRDQALVEVLTDKASSELPSPVAGTVIRLGAAEGDRLTVGEVLIELDDGSEPAEPTDAPDGSTADVVPAPKPTDVVEPGGAVPGRVKAAPSTRKLARDLDVDLNALTGSGPGGRIA
ncbi:MAG TPA: branched-chain alpha-keto acid dehydrogenase subunit E2, partial [Acidimicrobiaceae bacterium]|nr:branched-chain alpha-keto acid dehydrogenase subunit E2 [Acidimicrobiaceae bacterium]